MHSLVPKSSLAFRNIAKAAVSNDGDSLIYLKNLNHDPSTVLAAVTQNGRALTHAHRALQNDKEIVLAAVAQNGQALEFASRRLRNDPSVVKVACLQNPDSIRHASTRLQQDQGFMQTVYAEHLQQKTYAQKVAS